LTQYRRVTDGRTDGQTDGIAIASTALAMRALRRAVKTFHIYCALIGCYIGGVVCGASLSMLRRSISSISTLTLNDISRSRAE